MGGLTFKFCYQPIMSPQNSRLTLMATCCKPGPTSMLPGRPLPKLANPVLHDDELSFVVRELEHDEALAVAHDVVIGMVRRPAAASQ